VGDDIFIVEDLGDNRIRLIPAPTYVSEPGTPVNKALLQPMENHMGDVANPHATTKAQVGLGNVDNVKQATKAEFDAHANLTAAHSATSTATANRIIIRDSAGRAKVAAPSASDDIARKAEVDAVSSALNSHKSSGDHHARYTDAEAIAAVWGAAGSGSELDADKLDGYDANPGVVKDTIPVRDENAKVPGSITGDAATVGGKPASDFLLKAGGNPTGVINFDAVSTGRIVLPVGTDQYAT